MRQIDYAKHNAEVEAVWDAYKRGKPTRVPMILGINPGTRCSATKPIRGA